MANEFKHLPESKAKENDSLFSAIWVIPLIAALVGAWLVFQSATEDSVLIEVTFKSASGLEVGKTPVKLRNINIGKLVDIRFAEDLSNVIVTMKMTGVSEKMLTDTTKFWVVKPRVGAEGVSGLDTLLSGAYIEVDPGHEGQPKTKFQGLENPGIQQLGNPGTKYKLSADNLGSLNVGSPIKFRGVTVGSTIAYQLSDDHSGVEIEFFVKSPHDKFISEHSRFWNASGVNVKLDSQGIDLKMESIGTLLAGGVAFTNNQAPANARQADENRMFKLYQTEIPLSEETLTFGVPMKLYFSNGISGLSVGAEVEYKGLRLGTVTAVGIEAIEGQYGLNTFAIIDIEPERLPIKNKGVKATATERTKGVYTYFSSMIEKGLRGQLNSNLLTGKSSIVLSVFPNLKSKKTNHVDGDFIVPTVPETVSGLIEQVEQLLAKFKSLPLEKIAGNLNKVTVNLNKLIKTFNVDEGGETGMQVNEAMIELRKAARSIRVMSEYLERHPESLIKGKLEE